MSAQAKPMTSAQLEALPGKAAPYYVSVGGIAGLVVCILPSGRKTFSLTFRSPDDGKAKRVKIGTYPATSLKAARSRALIMRGEIEAGADPVAEKKKAKAKAAVAAKDSVEAVAGLFVKRHCIAMKRKAWFKTERLLQRHVIPEFGKRPITSITRSEIKALLYQVHDEHGPYEANRVLSAVSSMFNWALDDEIVQASPCTRMRRPGLEEKRDRTLTDDELRAIWYAAQETDDPKFEGIVKLLMLCPQRRGEVAGMLKPEIAPDYKMWTINGARTKNSLALEIPWADPAKELVAKLPKYEGALIFPGRYKQQPLNCWGQLKNELIELAGSEKWDNPDWRLHDLRRTVRTRMSAYGYDPEICERLLGHVPGGVRAHYDRYQFRPEKKKLLEMWATELHGILTAKPQKKAA